ncbi:hypothetical protein [Paenibacillus sp. IHBB 10380]|uniref:hypothetical protein n=1 Tax=Paenibacillus sp. IHBB 10380 TaxID=1566358 RepID=UPI0005CFBEFC|nr:hypothetical protein [Paenibacillus sp. IHBB 10380]AJS60457.1 hypothetical protein UB51_20605 [Paenibacillus sp. IHBB 10380]
MTNLVVIFLVIMALILLLDWKVLRTLPPSNRWLTCSMLILSLAIFIYNLKFEKRMHPTVWMGRIIERWAPFE